MIFIEGQKRAKLRHSRLPTQVADVHLVEMRSLTIIAAIRGDDGDADDGDGAGTSGTTTPTDLAPAASDPAT